MYDYPVCGSHSSDSVRKYLILIVTWSLMWPTAPSAAYMRRFDVIMTLLLRHVPEVTKGHYCLTRPASQTTVSVFVGQTWPVEMPDVWRLSGSLNAVLVASSRSHAGVSWSGHLCAELMDNDPVYGGEE